MAKFQRDNFDFFGGYLTYTDADYKNEFVARFKYGRKDKARLVTFLIKNFDTKEYFDAMKVLYATPIGIARTKGFMTHNEIMA